MLKLTILKTGLINYTSNLIKNKRYQEIIPAITDQITEPVTKDKKYRFIAVGQIIGPTLMKAIKTGLSNSAAATTNESDNQKK